MHLIKTEKHYSNQSEPIAELLLLQILEPVSRVASVSSEKTEPLEG